MMPCVRIFGLPVMDNRINTMISIKYHTHILKGMMILCACSLICAVASAQDQVAADTTIMSVDLKEVEVRADGLVVGHDKMMLNVDKNLRKHSHDGYSLLNVAMIPGLDVDPFDRTVKADNQNVLLCINGVEATQGEIRTLNPKDVMRIDFYTGYDPRHPDSRFTLDFIVKIRDYGGAVVLEASQHLNKLTGSDMADWRMYRGKTEFGVRIEESYDSYAQGRDEDENVSMDFDRGNVMMSVLSMADRNRSQSLRVKPYLVYRKKNETLKLTFALQQQHKRENETYREKYVLPDEEVASDAKISDHSDRLLPSMSGSYQHKYSNSRYLNVFFSGNYSHTHKAYDYRSLDDVMSRTHENFYGGSATVQYSFGFSDTQKGFVSAGGGVNYSKIRYDENDAASISRLTTRNFRIAIGDSWRVCRALSVNLMLAGEIGNIDSSNSESTQFTFIPNLRAYWGISEGNTLSYTFSINSSRPPMSYYSPDEKWVMRYVRQVGNPDLKMSRVVRTDLKYRNVRKWGYIEAFGSYFGMSKAVYYDFRCDNSRNVYIQTFRNGGTFHDISAGPRVQVKIIPRHVTLRVGGEWNYTRAVTYAPLHRHTFKANANLMCVLGGFTANVVCSTPAKTLDVLGVVGYTPWSLQMSVNYDINNWTVGVTARNPFMTTPTRSIAVLPGITAAYKFYSSRIRYNMVALTVGYRFGYGKPKKKYEEVEMSENENSAILGL